MAYRPLKTVGRPASTVGHSELSKGESFRSKREEGSKLKSSKPTPSFVSPEARAGPGCSPCTWFIGRLSGSRLFHVLLLLHEMSSSVGLNRKLAPAAPLDRPTGATDAFQQLQKVQRPHNRSGDRINALLRGSPTED